MPWLSLLKLFLSLAFKIFDYLERESLMTAGEARALTKQMEELNERAKHVIEVRQRVSDDTDAGRLRDDDGYKLPERDEPTDRL